MDSLRKWLNQRKFAVHLAGFLLIVLSSIGLYFAAGQGSLAAIYVLLAMVILGNLLAMSVP
jgi:hypothetical protein